MRILPFFAIACLAIIVFFFYFLKQSKPLPIEITNESNINIDTFYIEINNYRRKVLDIKKESKCVIDINRDSIKLSRDLHIDVTVVDKNNTPFKDGLIYYNDLVGSLKEKYFIKIGRDSSVSVRSFDKNDGY